MRKALSVLLCMCCVGIQWLTACLALENHNAYGLVPHIVSPDEPTQNKWPCSSQAASLHHQFITDAGPGAAA